MIITKFGICLRSEKIKMKFPPKSERTNSILLLLLDFVSFLEEIEDTKMTFRHCMTFSNWAEHLLQSFYNTWNV